MLRTTLSAALALTLLAVVEPARAQAGGAGIGTSGQFIVSADRLMGLNVWSFKTEQTSPAPVNPTTTKVSGTGFNLLWGGDATAVPVTNVTPNAPVYSIPRLAFDYVAIPGLTVGASLGYFNRGGTVETTRMNVTMSVDAPSGNSLLLVPRVGYIFDFTPLLGVWARGGFTYYWGKSTSTTGMGTITNTSKTSFDGLALSLDPQLVITPVPHFGITVGPMLDLPLAGSAKTENTAASPQGSMTTTTESSVKLTNWGLTAGILGYF
jgi:hypothetical protein